MKKILFILIPMICLGQVSWSIEAIDSMVGFGNNFPFHALAIDTGGTPHVVYIRETPHKIMYAYRPDTIWQRESLDSGLFYYGFSLTFDANNKPYFTNYCRDTSVGKTYLRCATQDSLGWSIEAVDSSVGYLGNWYQDLSSSIDIDTLNLPGIAYIAWNVEDSLHYVKYAHFNGVSWDTSIVEYDSAFANTQIMPTDWSPSLKYSTENVPYIAYHQIYNQHDTVKIAYFDDSLNMWYVNPVVIESDGGRPVSMVIDSQNHACLAHGWSVDVAYTWWDGMSWHTETTGTTMGWSGIKIVLDIDSLDNPHILYRMDMHPVGYCYKRNNTWRINNFIGSTMGDISFALDNDNDPNICFEFMNLDTTEIKHLRFAKGTFVGIEEYKIGKIEKELELQVFPNPTTRRVNIQYTISVQSDIELTIYDVTGARKKSIQHEAQPSGWYQEKLDVRNLPSGVYFVVLRQGYEKVSKKFLLVR